MKINLQSILEAPALMTVKEVKDLLGTSESTLYRDIKDGTLATFGEHPTMIRKDDLIIYLGLSKEDWQGIRKSFISFPTRITVEDLHLVVSEEGELIELWIGEVGKGRLFELTEIPN